MDPQGGGSQSGGSQTGSQSGASQSGGAQGSGSQSGGSQTGGAQGSGSQSGAQGSGSQSGGSQSGGAQGSGSQSGGAQGSGSQNAGPKDAGAAESDGHAGTTRPPTVADASSKESGTAMMGPVPTNPPPIVPMPGPCSALPAPGGQWQNISPPNSNYGSTYVGINAMAIRPDNPSIIYVGADSNGIFKSTDCGSTWTLANTGRNAASLSSGRPWSLVIDPVEPDVMYTIEGYGDGGVWKTTNAGVDWDQILTPNIMSLFSLADSVTIDPTDHTHLVVQSHGCTPTTATCLAESTDSGMTWTSLSVPTPWGENSATAILSRTTWLYCLLDGGLWRTTDQGVTWKNITPSGAGGASCNVYQPYVFQDANKVYYLTSWDSASNQTLMRSQPNDSGSWSLMTFTTGTTPGGTTLMPTANHVVWSSEFSPNYYIASKNDLSTWSTFPAPPPSSSGGGGVFMAYDNSHQILYSANFKAGLWRIVTD